MVLAAAALAGCPDLLSKSVSPDTEVRLSGNFEVVDAEVSFKIPGRIDSRLVTEGDKVEVGQEVARLDSAEVLKEIDLRKADVELASAVVAEMEAGARPEEVKQSEAMVQAAQAQLDEVLAGARSQEVKAVGDELAAAKVEVSLLEKEKGRIQRLFDQKAVPEKQRDATATAYNAATQRLASLEERYGLIKEGARPEQIDRARAALKQAQERHAMVLAGPRAETLAQGRARLAQAQAALGLAQVHLESTILKSPIAGMVLSKNLEPGEFAAPGTPVVTVGDLAKIYLRAYIDEADLGRVKVGQAVQLTTDTYPGKVYPGKITFISSEAEFTPKSVQTAKERVKLVYRVKIAVENPSMELKPGMPADAVIAVK